MSVLPGISILALSLSFPVCLPSRPPVAFSGVHLSPPLLLFRRVVHATVSSFDLSMSLCLLLPPLASLLSPGTLGSLFDPSASFSGLRPVSFCLFPLNPLYCPSVPLSPPSFCPFFSPHSPPPVSSPASLRPAPLFPGEPLLSSGVPAPLRSARRVPLGQPPRFLSSSRTTLPLPGPQPTPPLLRPPLGSRSPGPARLRGGGAPGRPQKLLCREAQRARGGAGRGLRRRGWGPAGTAPPPPPAPAPAVPLPGAYLGARCPPPAARACPGRAARTSASAPPPRP